MPSHRFLFIFTRMKSAPIQDRELLTRLLSGKEESKSAWREFLSMYTNLFLKIIWQFSRDHDEAMERYLYVCEKLSAADFAILKKFNPARDQHPPKLSTWLTIVVKNLCVEAHRTFHGRRRYPQALLKLSDFDRTVFSLRYWKGYSREEIEEEMKARRNGTENSVSRSLKKIDSVLTRSPEKNAHSQRNPIIIPLDEYTDESASNMDEEARELEAWFESSIRSLTQQERIALRLRFWEDLTAKEIGTIMNITPVRKVYSVLENGLRKLKNLAHADAAA